MKKKSNDNEVLFQKLGTTWYLFTEIDGEIYYTAMPKGVDPHTTRLELHSVMEEHLEKISNNKKSRNKRIEQQAA